MGFTSLFYPLPNLTALYVAATLVPVTALVWLGWRLLEQDRALENQRIQERLENAVDLIAGAIERRLADLDKQLVHLAMLVPGLENSIQGQTPLIHFAKSNFQDLTPLLRRLSVLAALR